jgi:FkbM family methyltransferase
MISKEELRKHLIHRRPEVTSDADWGQLTVIQEYKHLPITGKRVMDIGGNIGAMAVRCALEKCELVVSYEPEPANYDLLEKNTRPFANVLPVNAAVTNDPSGRMIDLWLTNTRTMGSCSIIPFRGRTPKKVKTINFQEELERHRFQSIKMDCEGAEWYLLAMEIPPYVKDIVAELHFTKKEWRNPTFGMIMGKFSEWDLIHKPKDTGKNFHTLVHWRRK